MTSVARSLSTQPCDCEAPLAPLTNPARQGNIGPKPIPLQTGPPAFLGLPSLRKEGFNAPLKPGHSRRSTDNQT
jgi:hypothetical protein